MLVLISFQSWRENAILDLGGKLRKYFAAINDLYVEYINF